MKIGIDCRTILNPEKGEGAGIGHYTYQLVRHLLKIDQKNTYLLFFDRTVQPRRLAKFQQANAIIKFFPFLQYSKFLPNVYRHHLVNAFLSREKLDIFHSPTLSLPTSYQGLAVATAHDLAIYKFPELYPPKQISFLKTEIFQAIKQAKKIIAVSESTKKDLGEIFGLPAEKIKVIANGLDERFFKKSSPEEIDRVKKKYGLKDNYILFLGTLDARKNIIRIVEAYERLIARTNQFSQYQLVLAGQIGKQSDEIKKRIDESKYRSDIILPGYIEADDLDPLFESAKIFLFPSLYEGFGLPVIEAMANGVPVITSNISSLPEVAKGHALLVDPFNVADITQSLVQLLTDQDLYQDLSKNGKKRAQEFTWEKAARETLKFYQEVIVGNMK